MKYQHQYKGYDELAEDGGIVLGKKGALVLISRYTRRKWAASGATRTNMQNGWRWNWPRRKPSPKRAGAQGSSRGDSTRRAKVDVTRINELESRVKHDVIAFTMAVGESIGDPAAARWLHYGLTSNDVVDTAQALLIRDASHIIERDLVLFGEVLDLRAHEFRNTPQIGRTHGIHAEPITFGLKIANWFAENQRNIERFRDAAAQMAVGKISGAVGNASHLGPEIEERICKRLGLRSRRWRRR